MHQANLYSSNNREQAAAAEFFLNNFGEFLRANFRNEKVSLIDIGSGCGTILSDIVIGKSGLKFSKVIGIDINLDMVKCSNKKYSNDLILFKVMDAGGVIPDSLKNQQFDFATSFYAAMWFNDLRKAFMNIHSMLNNDGLFCCVFLQSHLIFDIWDKLEDKYSPYMKNWKDKYTPLLFKECPKNFIRRFLIEAGFEIIIFLDNKKDFFDYGTAENFTKSMKAVNPCMKQMPVKTQEEFLKDQLDVLMSMQDGFAIPRSLIYFVAKKLN